MKKLAMLDQFLREAPHAGPFTGFRAASLERAHQRLGHGAQLDATTTHHRQVVEAPRTDRAPAGTQEQQARTSTTQQEELAHIGAWTEQEPN